VPSCNEKKQSWAYFYYLLLPLVPGSRIQSKFLYEMSLQDVNDVDMTLFHETEIEKRLLDLTEANVEVTKMKV